MNNNQRKKTMKKEKDPDREQLLRYCREVNEYVKPFGHRLLWNVRKRVAVGTCDCRQKVVVGLDDKESLTHIGKPIQCPVH